MRRMKWVSLAAAVTLIIACFMVWVVIPSKQITVSGVNAAGTNFGKPGYLHLLLTFFFVVFTLIPKIWAKRSNLLVTALNLAWAIRNFIFISSCSGGECPEKQAGLYLVLGASILMLVSSFFPDIKLPAPKNEK